LLAGFSQGGGVALGLLRDDAETFRGAVVVNSLYPTRNQPAWEPRGADSPQRVVVMAGALDKLLPRSKQAHQDLLAAGVESRFIEFPATGHEYPHDFAHHATRGLQFLLGK
jgi:predicted esterase